MWAAGCYAADGDGNLLAYMQVVNYLILRLTCKKIVEGRTSKFLATKSCPHLHQGT